MVPGAGPASDLAPAVDRFVLAAESRRPDYFTKNDLSTLKRK